MITEAIPASGLNQAALAEALDVTPGFISQFASGRRPVPWDKAAQLSALLGLSPEDISAEYRRISNYFGGSTHGQVTAEIVTAAVALAKESSGQKPKSRFDVESSPDVFAAAINKILAAPKSNGRPQQDFTGTRPRSTAGGRGAVSSREKK
ncbi:helix-turn-helix transcriptional regulator [Xanthomonas sp. XNM01]|nr:helix-turn-helix transcriptional regulator [Xanthomonas sp. XNM01]